MTKDGDASEQSSDIAVAVLKLSSDTTKFFFQDGRGSLAGKSGHSNLFGYLKDEDHLKTVRCLCQLNSARFIWASPHLHLGLVKSRGAREVFLQVSVLPRFALGFASSKSCRCISSFCDDDLQVMVSLSCAMVHLKMLVSRPLLLLSEFTGFYLTGKGLGHVRNKFKELLIEKEDRTQLAFLWVYDFPLFQRYSAQFFLELVSNSCLCVGKHKA